MSQRASGFLRQPNEAYSTPVWVAEIVANHLRVRERVRTIWEPAAGDSAFAVALRDEGFGVIATTDDFLKYTSAPEPVDCVCTNPPYCDGRRSELACAFIRHALDLAPVVAMLLRVDFDSAKGRKDLFSYCPRFAGKIVLLDRIKWFDGPSSPSDNHAWFVWNRAQRWAPSIFYAERTS